MANRALQFGYMALLVALVGLKGCATSYTQIVDAQADVMLDCPDSLAIPNIYSGATFDIYCLGAENAAFFCLVDLPMSFMADSALLPYTIYRQYQDGYWYQQQTCNAANAPSAVE